MAAIDHATATATAPAPPPTNREWRLLGQDIGPPIGVAASPLTRTAKHLGYFARHGFNVLTFKTMRSIEWRAHRGPNWVYLEEAEPLAVEMDLTALILHGDEQTPPPLGTAFSTANSYGVPSSRHALWQRELSDARELIGEGRLLIASVQGSPEVFTKRRELVADFVKVARLAAEAEPSAIELNLSCPNTIDFAGRAVRPPLCSSNPAITREIVVEVREAIPEIPIVAKLSYLRAMILAPLVASIATAVDGIAGVNTVPATVLARDGRPAFRGVEDEADRDRAVAGLSGVLLRNLALDFINSLATLRRLNGWSYDILGMGGVMGPGDVRAMMERGANAVQVATAAVEGPRVTERLAAGVLSMAL